MDGIGGGRISLMDNNFLVLFEITIILGVTFFFLFSFFFFRNRGGFFHVIFDESQSVERVRTIGLGKSFEIVEMEELFYNISKLTI